MKIEKARVLYGVSRDQMVFSYSNQPEIARSLCEKSYETSDWHLCFSLQAAKEIQALMSHPDEHPIVRVTIDYTIEEIG
jgi:hypothetical protein